MDGTTWLALAGGAAPAANGAAIDLGAVNANGVALLSPQDRDSR